jgi:hypothetical protein
METSEIYATFLFDYMGERVIDGTILLKCIFYMYIVKMRSELK